MSYERASSRLNKFTSTFHSRQENKEYFLTIQIYPAFERKHKIINTCCLHCVSCRLGLDWPGSLGSRHMRAIEREEEEQIWSDYIQVDRVCSQYTMYIFFILPPTIYYLSLWLLKSPLLSSTTFYKQVFPARPTFFSVKVIFFKLRASIHSRKKCIFFG